MTELEEYRKNKEQQKKDGIFCIILGYVFMPISLPCHTVWFICKALIKPLRCMKEDVKNNPINQIDGEYNEFEFLFSHICN